MPSFLFIDPQTGEQVFYEELLNSVCAGSINYAPFVHPATPGEAVRALLTAVVLAQPLTLFDSDFSSAEREAFGGTDVRLAKRIRLRGRSWSDPVEMQNAARQQSEFALTLFTSGTTGQPKQVTHDLEELTRMLKVNTPHAGNVWGLAYNPTHIAGVQVILQAFFNGNPLVNLFKANRAAILSDLIEHGISHLSATPSFFRLLLPLTDPLEGLRSVTLGGECSNADLLERLQLAFPQARLHNIYASTESGSLLMSDGDVFTIPAKLQDRVKINDSRIAIHRSLLGKLRYEKQKADSSKQNSENGDLTPERRMKGVTSAMDSPTAKDSNHLGPEFLVSDCNSLVSSDWYDTGDVVEVIATSPARFRIIAREREMANVGGLKVNLHEIEVVLCEHPYVSQARVFARENSVMGQILCAEVVLQKAETGRSAVRGDGEAKLKADGAPCAEMVPQWREAELRAWLGERLQPFKIPRLIRFVDSIPLTRTGKVVRR